MIVHAAAWLLIHNQVVVAVQLKFIYSEKATNFCKIPIIDLSYVVTVKSTVEISQNFVVFSELLTLLLI